jgi:uncharacterized protein YjbJ (UPF0337 family)
MSNGTNLDTTDHKKSDAAAHHAAHGDEKHEAPAHRAPSHAKAEAQKDPIEAHWKALSQQMKAKWPSLTDDDLKFVDKTKFALLAKIKERTGLESETAERQFDVLFSGLGA